MYSHCCVNVIMRPSGSHNAALRLLYKSSFGPRSNLSLRPCFSVLVTKVTTEAKRWVLSMTNVSAFCVYFVFGAGFEAGNQAFKFFKALFKILPAPFRHMFYRIIAFLFFRCHQMLQSKTLFSLEIFYNERMGSSNCLR